jgi:hypothetical protein
VNPTDYQLFGYNAPMTVPNFGLRRVCALLLLACALGGGPSDYPRTNAQQAVPTAGGARTIVLPRQLVSGEQATLAVLDTNGRLTPGVGVSFSNGDHLSTDITGRTLFVAPLNPGVLSASIAGRSGRVYTTIVSPAEDASTAVEVSRVPRLASLSDRFEIAGRGFCGAADGNEVSIAGQRGLVLASSPTALVVLPPADLAPGPAVVSIHCGKRSPKTFSTTFVALGLEADTSPLAPGEHRTLTVRVRGTDSKVALEARNLAPDVAELSGGNPARASSTGGADNVARFDIVGQGRGTFMISIRLAPRQGR